MKLRVPGLTGATGYAIANALRSWMSTLRYEVVYEDRRGDPAAGIGGPRIYLVWHEYMTAPIYLRAGCRISILVSRHRDADLLESIARHSGYDCVRGSTARGGAAALKSLVEHGKHRNLVITPDGPRGPRRRLAAGPVFLASKLGLPIVPMGFGFDRCWRLGSWDRFAIARPFTTCRTWLGRELCVPAGLDRQGIETQRLRVEGELRRVTESAEAWAAGVARPPGAEPATRCELLDDPSFAAPDRPLAA